MQKNIVLIGGGHGLSSLVKSFKYEDINLSVIVSSSDDGGHTGKIRDEFNTIALGDLRMVINELLEEKSSLKAFFNYRFDKLHGTEGVSIGNLILFSLLDKYKDMNKVVDYFKEKENIHMNIFLSSYSPLTLCALTNEGEVIKLERNIGVCNKRINKIFMDKEAVCNEEMLKNIMEADLIVLSPGSLYTSVGSVLCIDKIKESMSKSHAKIIYVCNIMTQDGETRDFTVKNHVNVLEDIMERKIDKVIINNGNIDKGILEIYKEENSRVVRCLDKDARYEFHDIVEIKDGKIRHDSEKTKKIILNQ